MTRWPDRFGIHKAASYTETWDAMRGAPTGKVWEGRDPDDDDGRPIPLVDGHKPEFLWRMVSSAAEWDEIERSGFIAAHGGGVFASVVGPDLRYHDGPTPGQRVIKMRWVDGDGWRSSWTGDQVDAFTRKPIPIDRIVAVTPPSTARDLMEHRGSKLASTRRLYRGLYIGTFTDAELQQAISNPESFIRSSLDHAAGIHWTDDPSSAYNFALGRDSEGYASDSWGSYDGDEGDIDVGLVLEAEVSEQGVLERGTKEFEDYAFSDAIVDYSIEREVPIREGTPLTIVHAAVVWYSDDIGEQERSVQLQIQTTAITAAQSDPEHIGELKKYDLRRQLSDREVEAKARKVIDAIAARMGVDLSDVEIVWDEYLEGDARYSDSNSGWSSGRVIRLNPRTVLDGLKDPEYGVEGFRQISHETMHACSGTPWVYEGRVDHDIEEGGAEILSVCHWDQHGQPFDQRDAFREPGRGWVDGREALVRRSVYKDKVDAVIRRAASKVGWNAQAILSEVERVFKGDGDVRWRWGEETNPNYPLPSGVYGEDGALMWLVTNLSGRMAAKVSAYEESGHWEEIDGNMTWVQPHEDLVKGAMQSWIGWPDDMSIHMQDELDGREQPRSGSGKIMRAQARALLIEFKERGHTNGVPLYRGSNFDSPRWASWSERKAVASLWAKRLRGDAKLLTLAPGEGFGLKVEDYIRPQIDETEQQWIIVSDQVRSSLSRVSAVGEAGWLLPDGSKESFFYNGGTSYPTHSDVWSRLGQGHIRYRFGFSGGTSLNLQWSGDLTSAQMEAISRILRDEAVTDVFVDRIDDGAIDDAIDQGEQDWTSLPSSSGSDYSGEITQQMRFLRSFSALDRDRLDQIRGSLSTVSSTDITHWDYSRVEEIKAAGVTEGQPIFRGMVIPKQDSLDGIIGAVQQGDRVGGHWSTEFTTALHFARSEGSNPRAALEERGRMGVVLETSGWVWQDIEDHATHSGGFVAFEHEHEVPLQSWIDLRIDAIWVFEDRPGLVSPMGSMEGWVRHPVGIWTYASSVTTADLRRDVVDRQQMVMVTGPGEPSEYPDLRAAVEQAPLNPVTLYKGWSEGPGISETEITLWDIVSASEKESMAWTFVGTNGPGVMVEFLPGSVRAFHLDGYLQDHGIPNEFQQGEWLVAPGTYRVTQVEERDQMLWLVVEPGSR